MGLFDEVLVRYGLDEPAHNRIWFQTKSLDCCLGRYLVDEQGYLWQEKTHPLWRPFKGEPEQGPVQEPTIEQVPFHGDIDLRGGGEREGCEEVLYRIRFSDGRVSCWARATERSEHGFLYWPDDPFPQIAARSTKLVPPVFPPVGKA